MRKRLIFVGFVALAVGLAFVAGWRWRENVAKEACRQSEGKWLPRGGYCVGSKFGEVQY